VLCPFLFYFGFFFDAFWYFYVKVFGPLYYVVYGFVWGYPFVVGVVPLYAGYGFEGGDLDWFVGEPYFEFSFSSSDGGSSDGVFWEA